jgi:hypothetical protein
MHLAFRVRARELFGRKQLTMLSAWRNGLPKLGSIWCHAGQVRDCVAEQHRKTRSWLILPVCGKSALVMFNQKWW